MKAFIRGAQDVGMLLIRLALGLILIVQGLRRWQVNGINNEAARLYEYGLPAPDLLAWVGTTFEIVGGTLIVFGLATPLMGLVVLVSNAVLVYVKVEQVQLTATGWEQNLALAALGLVCLVFGSRRLGVDHLFTSRPDDAPESLIVEKEPVDFTGDTQQTHS